MDCLPGQDFHTQQSPDDPNFESCQRWCSQNNRCTAFVVYQNNCYFKEGDCQNDQRGFQGATVFIQGKANEEILFKKIVGHIFIFRVSDTPVLDFM